MNMPSFLKSNADEPFMPKSKMFNDTPKPLTREPVTSTSFTQRLTRIQQAQARPSFEADDPNSITVGCEVEHQRFGRGKVLELEGDENSRKATVLFQNAGRKQLLVKFARLKVVK